MGVPSACTSVHLMHAEPKDLSLELQVVVGNRTGSLQEWPVLLITELSLQPHKRSFKLMRGLIETTWAPSRICFILHSLCGL